MQFYDTPRLTYDSGARYDDVTLPPSSKRKNMAKVKFTLKDVPDGDAIQTCTNLKTALTGNANFPTPPVTPVAFGALITTAQNKLTASDNAAAASKQAPADKDTAIAVMAAAANQLAGYVDLTANGDESMILIAGLANLLGLLALARLPQVKQVAPYDPRFQEDRIGIWVPCTGEAVGRVESALKGHQAEEVHVHA